jgi:hypothetical protein
MAPSAQVYLATVVTAADLQAAVTYFAGQGVDIISRSLTAQYDGPGDGTGPIAAVIDNAVANGMAWFNSAGNTASDGVSNLGFGQYWRGGWVDADADGWLEFSPGDEWMGFLCGFANGLRWNDFGVANPTDYDLYIYDDVGDTTPIWASIDDQTSGALPLETNWNCNVGEVDYFRVNLWSAEGGTAGDVLEFMMNQSLLEHWQNPYSASGPASDTASSGGLTIGAIDPPLGTAIAPYSSWGPTNDGRTKPDLSAAACVSSFIYSPSCFSGTSAATPAAAGAGALILGANLATTPTQLKTYLLNSATTDRGAPGTDNVYGWGELILPTPPPDADGDGFPDGTDNCPNWYNPTQALPSWPIPADDPDCDGFDTATETFLGTDPLVQCAADSTSNNEPPPDKWPVDHTDNQIVNLFDLIPYVAALNSTAPGPPYTERLDLNMSGDINVFDLIPFVPALNETCTP